MASLTNYWPMVRFHLRVIREQWAPAVRFWRTVRSLRRVTQGRWVIQGVRSQWLGSNRSFRLLVILPGDRLQSLEPGNVT
jgi:hypothetical protein